MDKHSSASSITRQLQLVFAISIIILLVSAYASFYSNRKLIDSSNLVNHTNEVIINTENLISSVKDAETGQRGFIITNDAVFLQPYNGGYERTIKIWDHIKNLTTDNNLQQRNLDKIKVIIDQRFVQMQRVLDMGTGLSAEERTVQLMASHEEMLKGKKIMDDLRATVEQVKNEEKRLLEIRLNEQETYTKYAPIMVILAAIISIVLSLLAYARIKNDLDARIKKQREDEAKYIETQKRINTIEQVTQKIAEGDYSARSIDDAKDELGRISAALNDMITSLEANFNEMEQRNWLQTGAVDISTAIRGEVFIKNIADKIINSVANYVNAQVGTLYIADKDLNLKLQGRYATTNTPDEMAAGEGLTGQAALTRRLIVTDALPADYLHISSSIGSTNAAYAVVLPLVYGDSVIGVMELGMLHEPTNVELTFLKDNAETLAIGVNAAVNYEKMQDLLEETQAQSEELQAQHNELENINAELEVQTEKLQASEEELRVQQEELQQANQELEERTRLLEERNIEIIEKNKEVQRKAEELALSTKYKSEFLANMSHELRTPLNSILLLSRLLKENNEKNLNNDQVEYANVIQSSGTGLLTLIDEILDLSKIEAGKMQLEYGAVAINEITDEIQPLFEPVAKEKNIAFNISVAKDLPQSIETDKLRLGQVLKNLLSNAMKFTTSGSVNLNIGNCIVDPRFVCFSVKDTGIGIVKEKQKLIFEAFQQEDGSTRRKFGGTGLGLSISREIVKLLGGKIELKSEAGMGSEFIVFVPKNREDQLPDTEDEVTEQEEVTVVKDKMTAVAEQYIATHIPENIPDDRAKITSKDKTILIVEDDTNFAKSLLEYARKKGYKGIAAVRGDDGIELARQYKPTAILLDIQLPVKSGWQVMDELKKDPQTRHIPVHMMSSYQAKKESLLKGAVDFIDKPVAFEQMQQIFKKLEDVLTRDPKKVLIVEENSKHARALSYFLETFNVNTDIKSNIADSVNALKSDANCVILDMGIPDQKSYDMLEEVKNTPGLENLPIIIFTGKSLSLAEEQRIRQYADSIVVKTAHSYQRILDEVSLFLHLVEEHKNAPSKSSNKKLGALNEVLKDKTVLVVDDDVRNIFSLTKALERFNMNIVTAVDGNEALVKLNENKNIDVVLLDMMMPEMDGYETAKKIRENYAWRNLPVIAVTAKAMTGDREKCITAGASDYITKPVDVDQLLSLLRVWLYERAI